MQKIEITVSNFTRILLLMVTLWFLYEARDIVILLFLAVIITSALNPIVKQLELRKVPRSVSILVIAAIVFLGLGVVLSAIIPPLLRQGRMLVEALPDFAVRSWSSLKLTEFVGRTEVREWGQQLVSTFSGDIALVPANVVRFGAGVVGQILTLVTLLIFTFYLIAGHDRVKTFVLSFFSEGDYKDMEVFVDRVEEKLGAWLRGQIFLMFLIGVFTFIGLVVLGVDFALPLALIAGLLEVVPIIGPIVSSIPALIVAAAISPIKALSVAIYYLLLQQLEGNLLVPRVMKKAVGVDPLVVILALMIGARLAGPVGALISVPVATILVIVYQERQK